MPAAERRAQVLDAAVALFAERGFAGTSLAELARAAGVSDGMLVKLFGSKRGLYEVLIERQISRTGRDLLDPGLARAVDPVVFFRGFAARLLALGRQEVAYNRLLVYASLERSEFAALFHATRSRAILTYLADYVRERVSDGTFRPVDPEPVARAFLGIIQQDVLAHAYGLAGGPGEGGATGAGSLPGEPSVDELAATYAELIVKGLTA